MSGGVLDAHGARAHQQDAAVVQVHSALHCVPLGLREGQRLTRLSVADHVMCTSESVREWGSGGDESLAYSLTHSLGTEQS